MSPLQLSPLKFRLIQKKGEFSEPLISPQCFPAHPVKRRAGSGENKKRGGFHCALKQAIFISNKRKPTGIQKCLTGKNDKKENSRPPAVQPEKKKPQKREKRRPEAPLKSAKKILSPLAGKPGAGVKNRQAGKARPSDKARKSQSSPQKQKFQALKTCRP